MSEILPDIDLITSLYHISEVSLVSTSSDQFVGHGLVPLPPGPVGTRYYPVLIRRGNLNRTTEETQCDETKQFTEMIQRSLYGCLVI